MEWVGRMMPDYQNFRLFFMVYLLGFVKFWKGDGKGERGRSFRAFLTGK